MVALGRWGTGKLHDGTITVKADKIATVVVDFSFTIQRRVQIKYFGQEYEHVNASTLDLTDLILHIYDHTFY